MFDPRILSERSIIVTGGGSGLGLAMASAFAAHGARVTIAGAPRKSSTLRSRRSAGALGKEATASPSRPTCATRSRSRGSSPKLRRSSAAWMVWSQRGRQLLVTSEDLSPNGFDASSERAVWLRVLHARGRPPPARAQGSRRGLSIVTTYAWTGTAFALPSACAKAGVLARTRSWRWSGARGHSVERDRAGADPDGGSVLAPDGRRRRATQCAGADSEARFGEKVRSRTSRSFSSRPVPYQTGDCVTMDGGEWLAGAGEFSTTGRCRATSSGMSSPPCGRGRVEPTADGSASHFPRPVRCARGS